MTNRQIFIFLFMLCFSLNSFSDVLEESIYKGQNENGQACEVKIETEIIIEYVLKEFTQESSSNKPFPGATKQVTSIYMITGKAEDRVVGVYGQLADLQAALSGETNVLSDTNGGYFNEGIGRESVTMQFANGKPISAEFSYSYLFTGFRNSVCSNLVKN